MTREEAIVAVKEVTGMSLPWNDRHYEALQMAIKALEEPDENGNVKYWHKCTGFIRTKKARNEERDN
jgi:hypothetical protein